MPTILNAPMAPLASIYRPIRAMYEDPGALLSGGRPRKRRKKQPELTPEEESSLLENIGGGLMSMLQYAGESLDKPGAAFRGVLSGLTGGEWGGGLENLMPFGETLGITKIPKKIYGRDLLEQWGVLDKNVEGLDWGDVAGFATDVVLDPLWLVAGPGRAISKAALDVAGGAGSKLDDIARAASAAVKSHKTFDDAWPVVSDMAGVPDDVAKIAVREAHDAIPKGKAGFKTAAMYDGAMPESLARYVKEVGEEAPVPVKGVTAAARAKEMRAGERGLVQLRMPGFLGGKALTPPLLTGERAGRLYEAMHYGKWSPILPFRYLFSSTAGGITSGQAQLARDLAYDELLKLRGALENFAPTVSRRWDELRAKYMHLADEAKLADDAEGFAHFDDLVRHLSETRSATGDAAHMTREDIGKLFSHLKDADLVEQASDFTRRSHEVLKVMNSVKDDAYERIRKLGYNNKDLDDRFVEHMVRGIRNKKAREALERVAPHILPLGFPNASRRNPILKHLPEGTLTINRLSRHTLLTGKSGLSVADHRAALAGELARVTKVDPKSLSKLSLSELKNATIWERYLKPAAIREGVEAGDDQWLRLSQGLKAGHILTDKRLIKSLGPELVGEGNILLKDLPAATDDLAKYLGKLPNEVRNTGLFDRPVMEDWFDYMSHIADSEGNLRTVHHYLGKVARQADEGDEGGLLLSDAWKETGLTGEGLDTFFANYAKKLGVVDDDAFRGTVRAPEGAGKVLTSYMEAMRPANQEAVAQFFRKFTAMWKGGVTIAWPAFHSRNLMAGVWQSWAHGDLPLKEVLGEYWQVGRFLFGKQDTLPYMHELKTLNLSGHLGRTVEIMGEEAAGQISNIPTRGWKHLAEPWYKGWGKPGEKLNPLRMRGAWGGLEEITDVAERQIRQMPLTGMGERVYEVVEFLNRASPYIALRKRGFSAAQALHRVKLMQFDYRALSGFEKKAMRNVFPFYTWSRKNIPYQFAKLIAQPGGRTAQTLRAMQATQREAGGHMPSFLGEAGAFRVGGTEEEAQFVRMTGLPIEDLRKFKFVGGLPSWGTVRAFAGDLHPLLRFPAEQWAGREFYTGRKLKHLKPLTGVRLVDSMLYGVLPTSRAITTARQVLDTRKTWGARAANVLTGFKTGTYDLPKWKLIDMQDAIGRQLEAMPEVGEGRFFYPAKRIKGTPREEEVREQIRLLTAMQQAMKRLQEERGKGAG